MICLWSADPTGKNLIHDLYSVVTRVTNKEPICSLKKICYSQRTLKILNHNSYSNCWVVLSANPIQIGVLFVRKQFLSAPRVEQLRHVQCLL